MSKYDARAAQSRGIGNDRSHRQCHGSLPAIVTAEMDAACPVVEMGDPQLLGSLSAVVKTGRKKRLCGRVSGKTRGRLNTFDLHMGTLGRQRETSHLNHVRFGGVTTLGWGWTRGGRGLG